MHSILIANPAVLGDPTDPPMTTPPTDGWATQPGVVNVTTDQLAPPGPGLGTNAGQNGIVRVDQTIGGTTTARNIVTWATGLSRRPAPFLRESWQGQPMPLNRLQGRVGYQRASEQLAVRVATQDAVALPTQAETAAAATHPNLIRTLNVQRGRRWSRG